MSNRQFYFSNLDAATLRRSPRLNPVLLEDVVLDEERLVEDSVELILPTGSGSFSPIERENSNYSPPQNMASNAPPPFYGRSSEDAISWIRQMDWFIQAQRPTTELGRIAIVAISLREGALHWFHSLPFEPSSSSSMSEAEVRPITTYEEFRERFVRRFQSPEEHRWRAVSTLFSLKQAPHQSTEAYISEIRAKGTAALASEDQMRYACLAGLRDDVKSHVLHHDVRSLDDIQRWGNIADTLQPAHSNVTDQIKQLRELIEHKLTVGQPPQMMAAMNPAQDQGYQQGYRRQRSGQGRVWQGNQGQQNGQGQGNGQRSGNINVNSSNSACTRCGRHHQQQARCPAQGATCFNCNRPNHFARVCRARVQQ